jgi:hypothetical protein
MIRYDPADRGFGEFFVYASCYWISHYGSVKSDPLPELDDVQSLCRPNSLRLLNWTSQNSRPDCVLKARFEFDGKVYDPFEHHVALWIRANTCENGRNIEYQLWGLPS